MMRSLVRRPEPASFRDEVGKFLAEECPPSAPIEVSPRELRTLARRILKSEDQRLREAGRALDKLAANERYSAPHTDVEHDPWRCEACARDVWWLWCLAIAYPGVDGDTLWIRVGALQGLRADEISMGLRESSEHETPDELRARLLRTRPRRRECFPKCDARRTRGFGVCFTCSIGVTPEEDQARAALVAQVRHGTNPRTARAKRRAEIISSITPAHLRNAQ